MPQKHIDEDMFFKLQAFIEETTGIYIPITRKYLLENRLRSVLKDNKIASYNDYLNLLKQSQLTKEQILFKQFQDLVSTHETSFFRHKTQMDVLENTALRNYMHTVQSRPNKSITVWSAGCSTGEECYSIAMLLYSVLHLYYSDWSIRVIGTDISTQVIAHARQGLYSMYAIRNLPSTYRHFFIIQEHSCQVIPEIRKLVEFFPLNLQDTYAIEQMPPCDIIFCRNVLIYFKENLVKDIVHNLYNRLLEGGLFLVSPSENIRDTHTQLIPYEQGKTMIYTKPIHQKGY